MVSTTLVRQYCQLLLLLACVSSLSLGTAYTQSVFPVKINQAWGLINESGKVVVPARYQAIGEFKHFGMAIMQRDHKVGLLAEDGSEALAPLYEDIKVVDRDLVSVMLNGQWQVVNLNGEVILGSGYNEVRRLAPGLLLFRQSGNWGLVNAEGHTILQPIFEGIEMAEHGYIKIWRDEFAGLYRVDGLPVLPANCDQIHFENANLIFARQNNSWGAVDSLGRQKIPFQFRSFRALGDQYILLAKEDSRSLYSLSCGALVNKQDYDAYYLFNADYLLVKRNQQMGLIDHCGALVLPVAYREIQGFEGDRYRVKVGEKWGIVGPKGVAICVPGFDYIAPLNGALALVVNEGKFGLINKSGAVVVEAEKGWITIEGNLAKAYAQRPANGQAASGDLEVLQFDGEGALKGAQALANHFELKIGKAPAPEIENTNQGIYQLDNFEWFNEVESGRWGLRSLLDGSTKIPPTFDVIRVEPELGVTLVGMRQQNRYDYERTTYRYEMVFGMLINDLGLLVTEVDFLHVYLEDFAAGSRLARFQLSDGRFGLIDRLGKIERRGWAYIGPFQDGVARASQRGRLSASMKHDDKIGKLNVFLRDALSPATLVDYTEYDQRFDDLATLICEDCEWGYLDENAELVIPVAYDKAYDFKHETGLVAKDDKWGVINRAGRLVVPCRYDRIEFMEHQRGTMLRLFVKNPKYGLIDTLGRLAVETEYDDLTNYKEGLLAVKRSGVWGFVDTSGKERIPCRYQKVNDFSEGLAACKKGPLWGFVNPDGEVAIGFRYKAAGNFVNGLAWVQTNQGAGYINQESHWVIPTDFDRAYDFQNGVARVVVDGKYGLIDTSGQFVLRPRYDDMAAFDAHGRSVVRYGNDRVRYGLIDRTGNLLTAQGYAHIAPFQEGLAIVRDKGKFGFIDTNGREVIKRQFTKASPFSEGRAAVQKDGHCGYILQNGNSITDFSFTTCQDFVDGKAVVFLGLKRAGLINSEGKVILEPSVNRMLHFEDNRGLVRDGNYRFYFITEAADMYQGFFEQASAFENGRARVRQKGKWGVINARGMTLIRPKYDKISAFENGYAKVRVAGLNGLSTLSGNIVASPNYESISYAGGGLFRVEKGDQIGYCNDKGLWIWGLPGVKP